MLSIRGLAKAYAGPRQRTVFRDVDLELGPGEYVAVMGESGVGKSTLLNLVAGLDRPDAGTIALDGIALESLDDDALTALRRTRMGFVFQAFHVLPYLSVAENVALPLSLVGVEGDAVAARVARVLAAVGLAERAESPPRELSGGELQRVAIARAIVHEPMLVLADEPTGNLDPETSVGIMRLLDRINRTGTTVVMATHDRGIVDTMRRRVIELNRGVIVRDQHRGVYE